MFSGFHHLMLFINPNSCIFIIFQINISIVIPGKSVILVFPSSEPHLFMICYPGSYEISYLTVENSRLLSSSAQGSLFREVFAYFTALHVPTFTCCASWWAIVPQIKTHSPMLSKDPVSCVSPLLAGSLLSSVTGSIRGRLESQRRERGFRSFCFAFSFRLAFCSCQHHHSSAPWFWWWQFT